MTPELVKWLIGALAACTVAIVGAVVWLTALTFRIGEKYGAVEQKLERFDAAIVKLDAASEKLVQVAVLENKVEQLEASNVEVRRRLTSDFPEVSSKVDVLWEKVFSLSEWRKSQGQYGAGRK